MCSSDLRTSWQPGLALEVAFVQSISGDPIPRERVTTAPAKQTPVVAAKTAATPIVEKPAEATASPIKSEPAKTEPKSEPPAESTAPKTGTSVQKIQENWPAIRAEVKRVLPQTEALLNSHRSLSIKDGVLIIGFASDMLKSKMDTADNLAITRSALQKVMGLDIQVQCTVVGNKSAAPAELGIEADGVVGTALNLGGKLIHKE